MRLVTAKNSGRKIFHFFEPKLFTKGKLNIGAVALYNAAHF
jgi:hypothetical protein